LHCKSEQIELAPEVEVAEKRVEPENLLDRDDDNQDVRVQQQEKTFPVNPQAQKSLLDIDDIFSPKVEPPAQLALSQKLGLLQDIDLFGSSPP